MKQHSAGCRWESHALFKSAAAEDLSEDMAVTGGYEGGCDPHLETVTGHLGIILFEHVSLHKGLALRAKVFQNAPEHTRRIQISNTLPRPRRLRRGNLWNPLSLLFIPGFHQGSGIPHEASLP